MKIFVSKPIRAGLFVLCMAVQSPAQAIQSDFPAGQETESAPSTAIARFFGQILKGEKGSFGEQKRLKGKEIGAATARVWKAWREACARAEGDKPEPLEPLASATPHSWSLPDSLEPHAFMPYYLGVKGNGEKPERGYPLFWYLHGSGPKQQEWATGLKICNAFDDAPSVYFIPQIPNEGAYYRWWQKAKQFAWQRLLRNALASGQIDPDRIYVSGISEGGYGSQRLASFYADYLAGAGPMAGGEPLKNAPAENCANIAFSLRTGAEDKGFYRNLLSGYVKKEFDRLQQEHPGLYVHQVELIPGKGHHIDYRPTTPWLKQHVRNPYPRYVCWEDYPMDGWHRTGFYNLAVMKRPEGGTEGRVRYEMTITGNDIHIDIARVNYVTTQKDPVWGIELAFKKSLEPASGGKLIVYLNHELVDLKKKVTLTINGKQVFSGKVKADLNAMVNSCATFFDPRRIYPVALEAAY